MSANNKPLVSVNCPVYNHEPYLRDCFEGFVKQKTSFPIEILVHDDASTDHSADIIREYTAKYPDLFKPIYQTENQYSKGVKISFEYQYPRAQGKYIALCEGDDYWVDPNKLQMQVDWLESHPNYTMCCSDAVIKSPDGILDWHRYENDCDIPAEDMILNGGGFILTTTLIFPKYLLNDYPEICKKCHVGDYPLQIWSVLNGKVRYVAQKTATYNFCRPNSWTSNQTTASIDSLIKGARSEFEMLDFLNVYSNGKYSEFFSKRNSRFLYNLIKANSKHKKNILRQFHDFEIKFNRKQKFEGILIRLNLWFLINPYLLLLQKKYKDALYSLPILRVLAPLIYYNILGHKKQTP